MELCEQKCLEEARVSNQVSVTGEAGSADCEIDQLEGHGWSLWEQFGRRGIAEDEYR